MKKILLTLFALTLSLTSIFANEAAVKEAIIRNAKLQSEGKTMDVLNYYTSDYVEVDLDGNTKINYNEAAFMVKALDGKHPEEFMIWMSRMEDGKDPDAQEMKNLRVFIQTAEFKKSYSHICNQVIATAKKLGELELKTIKFVNVEVKGNDAIAVVEYKVYDPADTDWKTTFTKRDTIKLRKVNGVWMYYESASKKISR